MEYQRTINALREYFLNAGLDEYLNSLDFFSDGIYGTYGKVWASFCSEKSEGGENTRGDSRLIHRAKLRFEYNSLNIKKEDILSLPDEIVNFYILNTVKKISICGLSYIKNENTRNN